MKLFGRWFLVTVVLAAVCAAAMAAAPTSRADKAAQGLLKFKDAVTKMQAQIDSTLASLNGLSSAQGNDLVSKYKDFGKQVDKTESMAKTAKDKAAASKAQREAYLKAWQSDQDKMQNEQLKAAAEARRAELEPMISGVRDDLTKAATDFEPFLQNLKDLKLYLGNDLTPQALAGAQELIGKCNESGKGVSADLAKGSEGLQALAARIAPGGAAK